MTGGVGVGDGVLVSVGVGVGVLVRVGVGVSIGAESPAARMTSGKET